MSVRPNPSHGAVRLINEGADATWLEAEIVDVQGGLVRAVEPRWVSARGQQEWDRYRSDGSRADAGVYWARIRRGGRVQERRFVLLG